MARTKQALFPARFIKPPRKTASALPTPPNPQPVNSISRIDIAPTSLDPAEPRHFQSPLVRKSPVRKDAALAPKPTRISKHARKSAPNTFSEVSRDQVKWALRANSNESVYAPSERGEDEDEDSLFVPMKEPKARSSESFGGVQDPGDIPTSRNESVLSANKADIGSESQQPSWHNDGSASRTRMGVTPMAQMVVPSAPTVSTPPRQTAFETRASITSASTSTTNTKSGINPVKKDPARRNPHSLPDLSAKLTSVITVTTRGSRSSESKVVTLHVAMLEDKSPFLTRLTESYPGPDLLLPELDCDAFSKFAAWVYGGGFEFDTFASDDLGDILNSVLDCYTLGLKLEATQFANAVLEKACKVSAERGLVFRNDVVNAMFTRTNRASKLRKWIVDEWVWQFDAEGVSDITWSNDRVLEKEIMFEMFYTAAKRLGKGRQKHRSPSEMMEEYRIPPGQDVVAVD